MGSRAQQLSMKTEDEYKTVRESALYLHVAEVTVRTWLAQRKLAFTRVGGRAIRIPQRELDRLVEDGFVPAKPQ